MLIWHRSVRVVRPYPACHMLEGNSLNQPAPPRGFKALLVTMTCGAVNDNLLRGALLLSVAEGGMWGGKLGEGGTGWITVMLYLPFVLLLGVTGQMADRYSKRTIIVWTRIAEVLLAAGVAIAFWFGSFYVTTALFVLLAAQSAFFSPAKYGSVPELVPDARLGWANGLLSLLTNAAIILGVAAAGIMLGAGPVFLGFSIGCGERRYLARLLRGAGSMQWGPLSSRLSPY